MGLAPLFKVLLLFLGFTLLAGISAIGSTETDGAVSSEAQNPAAVQNTACLSACLF